MAVCPFATWKPIGAKTTGAAPMTPTAVIDHSDAGYVQSLQGWWLNPQSGPLSCHFHIAWDGTIEQYADTNRRAIANVEANAYGISIEFSNSPAYRDNQVSFDQDVYSPAQIASAIRLHNWLAETHPTIPRQLCTDGVHGFGWHDKFPRWTTTGHVCPGSRRVSQLQAEIYPATFAPTAEDDDMTPDQITQATDTNDQAHKAALQSAGALAEAKKAALLAAAANARAEANSAKLDAILAALKAALR